MPYKHDYDKTLTRLITILSRLSSGEALSVKTLADEFNVSSRTIQRDFNERLVSMYPIYYENKKWKMQHDFQLEKATTLEDNLVLNILEKLTQGMGERFFVRAKTLLSKIQNETYNPIFAKLHMEDISMSLNTIIVLENAIKQMQELKCSYVFNQEIITINIKPLKIVNFEGVWYLVALDARNEMLKKYHLKSLSNIKVQPTNFCTTKALQELLDNAISIWFDETKKPFEVQLLLARYVAKTFKRKPLSKTQRTIKEYEDGSMHIAIFITHEMEILPIIKYYIPHIEVLAPKDIAQKVLKELQDYVKKLTKQT